MTIKAITNLSELAAKKLIKSSDLEQLHAIQKNFSLRITPELQPQLNNPGIAQQFIPNTNEANIDQHEKSDPIGDLKYSPVPGIVHRYPDRVLLMPTKICAVYCRFCFRKQHIGPGTASLTIEELDQALEYIKNTPAIYEVILSGGDPLTLSSRRLSAILTRINAIPHVQVIRIHTRVPIVAHTKINTELLECLTQYSHQKALYCILHINHPDELTAEALAACNKLRLLGISLLSQSVLLKNINNSSAILQTLFRKLVANHIKPYYLHHLDLAPGTQHFRVSIQEGQQIMRELRGFCSGICLPTYVLDIPDGFGKIPIEAPCIIEDLSIKNRYTVTNYRGETTIYQDLTNE